MNPDPMRDEQEPSVTRVGVSECDWALVDRNGQQSPHGTRGYWRVSGAGELLDGVYCRRHAFEAVRWWREGIEVAI